MKIRQLYLWLRVFDDLVYLVRKETTYTPMRVRKEMPFEVFFHFQRHDVNTSQKNMRTFDERAFEETVPDGRE